MTAPLLVALLQGAVLAVTALLVASLIALALGRRTLHGKLNTIFFLLAVITVLGLEVVVRIVWPHLSAEFFDPAGPYRRPLLIHLCFSVPATVILAVMMYTGRFRHRATHRALSGLFLILWTGTVVTGVGYLPGSLNPSVAIHEVATR
ncbi:MAG: hypothetical protein RMJ56_13650 [Gemmataceae bacterium]|nr:hypothetical protein [Gemmata sp.]MDW8198636.1 hypothetical protein [Gemmataceae bacterium]